MDLVDWSEPRFRAIEAEFLALADRFGFADAVAIPVSAVLGDNVAQTLGRHALVRRPGAARASAAGRAGAATRPAAPSAFPCRWWCATGQDFRGLAGTVASGAIAVGDEVVDAVSGRARPGEAHRHHGPRSGSAPAPARPSCCSSTRDIDVSRGAVLAAPDTRRRSRRASTRGWCGCPTSRSTATAATCCAPQPTSCRWPRSASGPISTSKRWASAPASTCASQRHRRWPASISAAGPRSKPSRDQRETGSFLLIDAHHRRTVAGGVVTGRAHQRESAVRRSIPADARAARSAASAPTWRTTRLRGGASPPRQRGGDPAAGGGRGRRDRGSVGRRGHGRGSVWLGRPGVPLVRLRRRHRVRHRLSASRMQPEAMSLGSLQAKPANLRSGHYLRFGEIDSTPPGAAVQRREAFWLPPYRHHGRRPCSPFLRLGRGMLETTFGSRLAGMPAVRPIAAMRSY